MIYVGLTTNYIERMKEYAKNKHKRQTKFYNATQKYGWNNFIFGEILEICTEQQLKEKEKYWIKYLNTFDISNNKMRI